MKPLEQDTIAAIATPPGNGGVGIVRISGPDAFAVADKLFQGQQKPSDMQPGTFQFGRIIDNSGKEIDSGLCLAMHAPHSFTGEDTVEIQGHGGAVNMRRVLRCALDAGARMAEAGEFSKRAFLNGKIDLMQAEAVCDLIHAQSERAAASAVEQLEGSLSRKFNVIYDLILNVAADLEATLDFAEEELPEETLPNLARELKNHLTSLDELLESWSEGRLLREGVRVTILGRPNAGKSTLLNALLGFDRAIVSDVAGTTRDLIEESLVLDGIPVRLTDTAGLRVSDCAIEMEGIRRAHRTIESADAAIYVIDISEPLHEEDRNRLNALDPQRSVIVLNKCDLRHPEFRFNYERFVAVQTCLPESRGLPEIRNVLSKIIEHGTDMHTPAHAVISERHRQLLVSAGKEARKSLELLNSGDEMQTAFAAGHLRDALELLGEATGRTYHDALLDTIFARFCVGK